MNKYFYLKSSLLRFIHSSINTIQMSSLETLEFNNSVLRKLPIDPEERNYVRTVNAACFSKVNPTPVTNPTVVAFSSSAMSLLDLPLSELERPEFAEYFSGNKLLPGSEPAAHCYCGHQFGYFSGQLGDGAAIYLGEVLNRKGERWEIQLKGAGKTPYSRTADGRKVLRSSIREFLCSEAMYSLGIPTTRAGACITSDSEVVRDIFYDGNPIKEKCSIVTRIAQTFIRFGSFEIFKTLDPMTGRVGPSVGRIEILNTLLNYAIETFYPEIDKSYEDSVEKYSAFFKEVVLRTARLVAYWQSVGFCHGVLNTDNMSIIGLTLDYGPFGFLDMYDPNHVCNASDDAGRYSFSNQPEICAWNLRKFAEAIQKALPLDVSLPLLELFEDEFKATYLNKMRSKLGLIKLSLEDDVDLVMELLNTMESTGADFTNTFCCFLFGNASDFNSLEKSLIEIENSILKQCYPLEVLIEACKPDMSPEQIQKLMFLINANPAILENLGRTGLPIRKLKRDLDKVNRLKEMTPELKIEKDRTLWEKWLEKYCVRVRKEMEMDPENLVSYNKERLLIMEKNNPRFILRNHIAQRAIEKAEEGDYSEVQRVRKLLETPYDHSVVDSEYSYSAENVNVKFDGSGPSTSCGTKQDISRSNDGKLYDKCPDWAFSLRVT